MQPLYSLGANPLLTDRITLLSPEKQSWQQFMAERLLGLISPAYTSEPEVSTATLAIVLQMNFQVAQGLDPLIEEQASSTHLKQLKIWRDRYLNPQAVAMVATIPGQTGINGDRWGIMTSFRTGDTSP